MSTALPFAVASEVCARCHGAMVVTKNAVGVDRHRCPACDGVTVRHYHPDEVLVPQTLVRPSDLLPKVEPGQLRCQRCARGVEGQARFHPECRPHQPAGTHREYRYQPKPCKECGTVFQPSGPRSRYCEEHQ